MAGALLHFSQEQIELLMEAMPPQQRRFARILAETITKSHEIWQAWVADEADKGQWRNVWDWKAALNRFTIQFDDRMPQR